MKKYRHFPELATCQGPFLHIDIYSPNQQVCCTSAVVIDHVWLVHWLPSGQYLIPENQCDFFPQGTLSAPGEKNKYKFFRAFHDISYNITSNRMNKMQLQKEIYVSRFKRIFLWFSQETSLRFANSFSKKLINILP